MKRLVQVFLSAKTAPVQLISEVSQDSDSGVLTCTCPGYRSKRSCKHTDEVQRRINENDGAYPLAISKRATQSDADLAMESEAAFRKFVISYGKIDVL